MPALRPSVLFLAALALAACEPAEGVVGDVDDDDDGGETGIAGDDGGSADGGGQDGGAADGGAADGGAADGGAADGGASDGGAGDGGASDGGTADGGAGDGGAGDGGAGDGGGEPPPTPASCLEALERDPSLESGPLVIDLDGSGGLDAFEVLCDMETDGGGWTVFWWYESGALSESGWSSVDVLGDHLWDCSTSDGHCFSRLPVDEPDELLVVGSGRWASWEFERGNSTSEAALSAFVDGDSTEYVLDRYGDAWNPVRQSEGDRSFPEPYSCNSSTTYTSDGRGCANFWYERTSGATGFNLDDDGGYAQTAFAAGPDNTGYKGVDAFETDDDEAHNSRSRSLTLAWR